jgi:hypothetical protein
VKRTRSKSNKSIRAVQVNLAALGMNRCVCKKVAQNIAQSIFPAINTQLLLWKKSSQIMCATSVIFTKLPKVNNHPLGKFSPNLVILGMNTS